MGLLSRIKNPVQGTAQVVGCEPPPATAMRAPCRMALVVQAPGVAPFSCEQTFEVWAGKWPSPGDALPVTFDRDHTDRMRVEWDQIANSGDQARQDADNLAAALRAQQVAGTTTAPVPAPGAQPAAPLTPTAGQPLPHGTVVTMGTGQPMQVFGAGSAQAQQAIAMAEQMMGMDVDGDGTVAGAPATPGQAAGLNALMAQAQAAAAAAMAGAQPGTVPDFGAAAPPAAPAPGDTIAELERLGALRDRGALTDAEFEAQKKRILGES